MTEFPLSSREKAMLRRLAKGWTTAEIRLAVGGTLDQVQEQQSRLLRKLQINSQEELIDAATRLAQHGNEKGGQSILSRWARKLSNGRHRPQ
jgi:DNA-binding NarL/FixJ family response regulator